jgi:hypothetical protein
MAYRHEFLIFMISSSFHSQSVERLYIISIFTNIFDATLTIFSSMGTQIRNIITWHFITILSYNFNKYFINRLELQTVYISLLLLLFFFFFAET